MYVPVLLMALLALGSYGLMRATPPAPAAAPERPIRHEPTDVLRGFSVQSFGPDGRLRSDLRGTEGRHYPDDGSLEVDQIRLRHVADSGVRFSANARHAWVNGTHDRAVLTGQAVVVREPPATTPGPVWPLEFQGNHLVLDSTAERITADEPVELRRGPDRIRSDRMVYQEAERVAVFTGRVRATLGGRGARSAR